MKTNVLSKLQIVAILLLFTGWGWTGGNFTPGDAPFINPLLHCIPLVLLMILSLPMLRLRGLSQSAESDKKWNIVGISVLAIAGILSTIIMISLGATNPDPNAVGVKSLEDWFPVVIICTGNFLWLGTLLFSRQHNSAMRVAGNN